MGSPVQRIVWPEDPGAEDAALVGPKAAALVRVARLLGGEGAVGLDGAGAAQLAGVEDAEDARPAGADGATVSVPSGFVVSTAAWRDVLATDGLRERLDLVLAGQAATAPRGAPASAGVHATGVAARELLLGATLPGGVREDLLAAHERLLAAWSGGGHPDASGGPMLLAVRSSATAEDLPDASFAGQYDSHLGVHGPEQLLDAYRAVLASLYSDRAIAYRRGLGLGHHDIAMAVGVQVLVRADLGGAAGVLFSRDPEDPGSGRTLIEAVRGLGEPLVGGTADPDRYTVGPDGGHEHVEVHLPIGATRPVLHEAQARWLARCGRRLETEWAHPVDVEWAIDGRSGELVLLQCRPLVEVRARPDVDGAAGAVPTTDRGRVPGRVLARGLAVGTGNAGGVARRVDDPLDSTGFCDGDVLVTAATDPSWLALMQRAGALVTDHGGRTSHAAIVSRELGLLAVVGCGRATRSVHDGASVEIACTSNGLGVVYGADESGDKSSPAGGVTVP